MVLGLGIGLALGLREVWVLFITADFYWKFPFF